MMQRTFAAKATEILRNDENVLGLAAAGSWITGELDAYSDLDLVLVTREKISTAPQQMLDYARRLGSLLHGFTGEHVGEPRVLICLYDDPLLHVDIKFLTAEEFGHRIENPVLLLDRKGVLQAIIDRTEARFPYPDYQWIEDRFWIWVHYALLKIGRGEYLEAFDFLGYLRMVVLGPLLHIRNGKLPRGVRKAEQLPADQWLQLTQTIPAYSRSSLLGSLEAAAGLYRQLRQELYPASIEWRSATEERVMDYFRQIRKQPD
jgi:hypothetical protein